jgi:hypothetical protein
VGSPNTNCNYVKLKGIGDVLCTYVLSVYLYLYLCPLSHLFPVLLVLRTIVQSGGHISFECSRQQGALLLLGDNAICHDVVRRKRAFLNYIGKYHHTWVTFSHEYGIRAYLCANIYISAQIRSNIVNPNELVLVTSYAKTPAWACGVFREESTSASLSLVARAPGVVGGRMSL